MIAGRRLNLIGAACIAAIGLAACGLFARASHAPHLFEDSYQYLDAARSVTSGGCFCTHVAIFDEQVQHGRMPIPFTHFAPGYPLLIAVLSKAGVSLTTAALIISVAGFVFSLLMIWDIALTFGARMWAVTAVSLLWLLHFRALFDATSVTTESAFTALLAAMAALIARDVRNGGARPVTLLLLGIAAGGAYDIRYAGLFTLPVAVIYILWRALRTPKVRSWAAAGLIAIAVLVGAVMARNFYLAGSWRGGFISSAHQSLGHVLADTLKSFYHLVFGDAVAARRDIWAAVFGAAFILVLFCIFRAFKQGKYQAAPPFAPMAGAWILALAAAYIAGIIATGLTTIADDVNRYSRPLYPLALGLAAPLLSVALRGRWIAAGIAAIGAILVINGRSFSTKPTPSPDIVARDMLGRNVQPGLSGMDWLRGHISPDNVLFSVYGQGVHYAIDRNVISCIFPGYTARRIDAETYREEMTQFHARYLLVFPGLAPDIVPEQSAVPFLRDLAAGKPAPDWLREDVRNAEIAVYECDSCTK